jgi:predicted amidohydrolase YtcJ
LTTVIHNAAIVTVDDRDTVHYDGAIAIERDRIAEIGSSADLLARYPPPPNDLTAGARWSCRASPTSTRISP